MKKIVFFTDFDGTFTGATGQDVFDSVFLKPVLNKCHFYQLAHDDLKKIFGKYHDVYDYNKNKSMSRFLLSADAVKFLKKVLENEEVEIVIVSRNYSTYIISLLKYHQFTDTEIEKITVYGNRSKEKQEMVENHLTKNNYEDAEHIYVLDDSERDYKGMLAAVSRYNQKNPKFETHHHHCLPGQFKWSVYSNEIENFTSKENSAKLAM